MNKVSFTASLMVISHAALAHGALGTGFVAGITHPLLGLDHMLAIVILAVLGYKLMEEKHWLPSVSFIIAMVIGGLLGVKADGLEMTELVIIGSVIVSGALLATKLELTLVGFTLMALIFGFFHGHAHGVEMPYDSSLSAYVAGYTVGAIALSGFGYGLSRILTKEVYWRMAGALVTGMGLMMMFS